MARVKKAKKTKKAGKKKKKQVVYAFIDSQNVNLAILDQGWRLDFNKFRKYLKDKYRISKAFLFIGYIPTNRRLYDFLHKAGYKIVFKPTVLGPKESVKGNVDAELVLHAMIEYSNYDKAVIVTGDGDFYCLVDYFLEKKKLKQLVIPNKYKYSSLLRGFSEQITFLNLEKSRLERKKEA